MNTGHYLRKMEFKSMSVTSFNVLRATPTELIGGVRFTFLRLKPEVIYRKLLQSFRS